tara:strand:- start:350 stop:1246 length:897 start_codon:yes stop_codon:yes gene_type:complete
MKIFNIILILVCFLLLLGCSSSYKELSNNDYVPKDKFSKYLKELYQEKANFEAKKMHDWNSTKLYSEKALKAINGVKVEPEKISSWNIPKNKLKELNIAYENLMIVYNRAIDEDPYNLAFAISSLDCWSEQQEENWQTWDINQCKNDFLNAMQNIYNNIEKNNENLNNKESTNNENEKKISVVTKNSDKEILQIIYFDFDKSNLSNVSINKIKKFVEKNKDSISNYLIVGHTDTKGSDKYNLKLSLERAESVKKILINFGINYKKIKILGKGETSLLVKTEDDIKHPANRRAEIRPLN